MGLTAVACSNLFMGGPAVGGGTAPVPQADPSEVLLGVGLTILSQLIGKRPPAHSCGAAGPLMSCACRTNVCTSEMHEGTSGRWPRPWLSARLSSSAQPVGLSVSSISGGAC